jgi:hypothetical protein
VGDIKFPLAVDKHEPNWHSSRPEVFEERRSQHDERRGARENKREKVFHPAREVFEGAAVDFVEGNLETNKERKHAGMAREGRWERYSTSSRVMPKTSSERGQKGRRQV